MKGRAENMTVSEHLEDMESRKQKGLAVKRGQSIYKEKSAEYQEEQLKNLIGATMTQLLAYDTTTQTSLSDVQTVKERTLVYVRCCQETGTFPSNQGLARMLGYTDRALRIWRQKHGDTETGRWLQMFSEYCAELLHQSALKNNANAIMSIFLSKANYDMRDENHIVLSQEPTDIEKRNFNEQEIRERLGIPAEGYVGGFEDGNE